MNDPSAKAAPPILLDSQALSIALQDAENPIVQLRASLRDCQQQLRTAFDAGAPTDELVTQYTTAMDQILQQAWQRLLSPPAQGLSLVAVGGYGRGELMPASDIDLLILMDEGIEADWSRAISDFLAALWDIGLEVGHAVRTIADCVEQSRDDITVATNLLESRLLSGDQALFEAMQEATGPDHMWNGQAFFQAKLDEQKQRHSKFYDTAYNLEPNIKENPGGLRDIQMIGWVAKRHYGCKTLQGLLENDFLTKREYQALIEGQSFLWRIRMALHLLTRRREDRLLFDHQRNIAQQLGYTQGDSPNLAVELFMKDYYRTVMELNRLNELLLALFKEQILYGDKVPDPVPINKRFQASGQFIEVTHPSVFKRYPFALLEIFLLMTQHEELEGVRASTIRLIRDHRYLINDDFRNDLRTRSLFMEILRQPHGVTHELRRMNRYGVLAAYIPAFNRIVGQMQYDLFHAYTVDEHTLFVVRNLRRFTVPEFAHELPFCSELIKTIPKLELLLLAGLFHDIAKGRGGDHSELGAREVEDFCRHHGLSQYDTELVSWLVQSHLLMSSTAQRRDISDPAIINEFARAVGNRVRLDYLYLLTVADIRGTNPTLWNAWKDSLLTELYQATARALRRGLENPIELAELVSEARDMAYAVLLEEDFGDYEITQLWEQFPDEYFLRHSTEELVWHANVILRSPTVTQSIIGIQPNFERGGTEIFLFTRVNEGLFERIAALLDQLGLDVMDARILTSHNKFALDTYLVLDSDGQLIEDEHRLQEIYATLTEGLSNVEQMPVVVNRRLPRQFRHFDIPTRVEFSIDDSNHRTIVELITGDRPGLLSIVGRTFTECGAQLENARIATFGSRAEDVFYVTDGDNHAIHDPEILDCVRQRLIERLDQKG